MMIFEKATDILETISWHSRLEEMVEEIEEKGFDVLEANMEFIVVAYEDEETEEDVQVEIKLGGTERTIVFESFREIYRG